MSFLAQIRGGLANAQHEVSKHVNAANIHRAIENSIATGLGNQATAEKQGNVDTAMPSLAEAARDDCLHVEIEMTRAEDASMKTETQPGIRNDATDAEIIGECSSISAARRDTDEASGSANEKSPARIMHRKDTCTSSWMELNLQLSVWARLLGRTPLLTAATVVTGTGLLVVAAPAILTAPAMGLAGAAGFTPAGIAASSAASAMHAGIGNVAVGSIFATLQSAATGGYGVAVLTGAAQTAGGAVAGVGGLGGIVTYLKGKPQPESTDKEKNE
ncbi:hypothetical protein TrVGV298_002807 [Trichoderma virens]|nr:hypothetical protein TrVGV298_002807 [Trichoderma virens]